MADEKFDPTTKRFYSDQTVPTAVKGARAGEDFASSADVAREKDMDAFLKEKGWAGLGNAAKRPPKPELEKQFSTWRADRAKAGGQRKAIESE